MDKKIGKYAFLVGIVLAVILGLALPLGDMAGPLTSLLVVLGLIVGFMNVTHDETKEFVTLSAILVFVAYAGGAGYESLASLHLVGDYVRGILENVIIFVVPAAVVVILKEIVALAKD